MASLKLLFPLILTLSVLSIVAQPPEPPAPPQSLVHAADTLENSGYTAMSLTLKLIAPTLPLPSTTSTTITALTIFSPPNAAFSTSGQPSLAHLLLHFSPLSLSPSSLFSLPFSSTIPSLSPSKHLTVTSTEPKIISINNVKVSEYPIFDDGFVIVYAIDNFFDLNFTFTPTVKNDSKLDFQCLKLEGVSQFEDASGVLKSRGYSIFASFLDLQLIGFLDRKKSSEDGMKWTVFAPVDEELVRFSGDFLGYSSLFMRHLVPCKVTWSDLDEMGNGTMVSVSMEGFNLEITKDEDEKTLMVNGVEIMFPDMYDSDWLVIHGIRSVIPLPENEEEGMELMEMLPVKKVEESTASDRAEF